MKKLLTIRRFTTKRGNIPVRFVVNRVRTKVKFAKVAIKKMAKEYLELRSGERITSIPVVYAVSLAIIEVLLVYIVIASIKLAVV